MVQKGWRLPEYTVTQESGPAHRKEFTMTCRVERFIEIGEMHRNCHMICIIFTIAGQTDDHYSCLNHNCAYPVSGPEDSSDITQHLLFFQEVEPPKN